MLRGICTLLVFVSPLTWVNSARSQGVSYRGIHPIAAGHPGKICYIEPPHQHQYGPDDPDEYVVVDASLDFVGDPSALGYEGPLFPYRGQHPLPLARADAEAKAICSIQAPHYHEEAPADRSSYRDKDGEYIYIDDHMAKAGDTSPMRPRSVESAVSVKTEKRSPARPREKTLRNITRPRQRSAKSSTPPSPQRREKSNAFRDWRERRRRD